MSGMNLSPFQHIQGGLKTAKEQHFQESNGLIGKLEDMDKIFISTEDLKSWGMKT